MPDRLEVTDCVCVRFADGTLMWTPEKEYGRNPDMGSYVVSEHKPQRQVD